VSGPVSRDYLADLASRAATGLARLPDRFRARQSQYILNAQRADGGFPGREGASDLYYTSFALRSAELLGLSDPALWRRAAAWLHGRTSPPADTIECFCMLHSASLVESHLPGAGDRDGIQSSTDRIEAVLDACRVATGGAARSPGQGASVYHTFLAALCCQLLDRDLPEQEHAVDFVRACRRPDGGFADQAAGSAAEGATNPTAAAVGFLALCDALDESVGRSAADFVVAMHRTEGGFAAHRSAPGADLMSTFTSLATLAELGALRRIRLADVGRYVQTLVGPDGGFRGAALDDAVDPEYTYYGLAALGLLGHEAATPRGCRNRALQPQRVRHGNGE